MSKEQSSYRQIMKATSIFGGVQVITIVIGIIRVKFLAIWIGPSGVGIIGLFNAPLSFISILAGLGLSISAVKEISESAASGDELRIAKIIKIFRRWVWFTGILGMVLTILFSSLLSKWTFGSSLYTWSFIFLSTTILFSEISAGQKALLQGTRRLKQMALATITGSIIGLFTSLPLYYFYGENGIVPALMITAFSSLIISWNYSRKVKIKKIDITLKDTFYGGLSMVKLGIVLTLSGLIGTLIKYLIAAYISKKGGIEEVGLYQAGFGLITGYVGVIFTAMSTDYFPRLAGTKDNHESNNLINQQMEIAILVITPICVCLIIALPIVIRLLYSPKFLGAIPMLEWVLIAVILKSIVWSMGFLFLAKGDFSIAFKVDTITNVFLLVGYITMYSFIGLEGIGIAELVLFFLGLLLTYYYAHTKYSFRFHLKTKKIILGSFLTAVLVFATLHFLERNILAYVIAILLLVVLSLFSIKMLNQRLDIKSILDKYMNKIK